MSENGRRILENLEKTIPMLPDQKVLELVAFSEGLAFMAEHQSKEARQ